MHFAVDRNEQRTSLRLRVRCQLTNSRYALISYLTLGRAVVNYCIYSNATAWEDVQQSDLSNYLTQFISDIITARGYVFGFGIGVALLIGFLYIGLLQIPFLVAVLVWSCVLLVLVSLLAIGFGAWATAEDWNEAGTKSDVSYLDDDSLGEIFTYCILAAVPLNAVSSLLPQQALVYYSAIRSASLICWYTKFWAKNFLFLDSNVLSRADCAVLIPALHCAANLFNYRSRNRR